MSPVLDHMTLGVSDLVSARRFYDRVMEALGFECMWENPTMVAYGLEKADDFGLVADEGRARAGTHVAFRAADRERVDAFHAAGVAAGGKDDGAPGLRPQYHAHYYAAFLIDPEGNRIEAVCHEPPA